MNCEVIQRVTEKTCWYALLLNFTKSLWQSLFVHNSLELVKSKLFTKFGRVEISYNSVAILQNLPSSSLLSLCLREPMLTRWK